MTKVALLGYEGAFNNATGSGVNRYMYELYHNLSKLATKVMRIQKTEIKDHVFGARLPFLPFLLNNIAKGYRDFDIVHNSGGNMLYLPFKDEKTRCVTTSFEFSASKYPELVLERYSDGVKNLGMGVYASLLRLTERLQLRSDHMIAISTLTKEDAVSLGYDRKRISVVNIGIDERFLKNKKAGRKDKLFRVGYVGSFMHKKNVIFAVKAFQQLNDKAMRMEVWGKKSNTIAYSQMEREAGKDKRISLMGFAPEDRLVDTYDSFDVYVHPVLYTGFEMEIIEAQARGLPVIVCREGRIPEEVKRYCFEAEDEAHMASIINDIKENGYKEGLRRKAMDYARSFTWEKTAKETIAVYERVAE